MLSSLFSRFWSMGSSSLLDPSPMSSSSSYSSSSSGLLIYPFLELEMGCSLSLSLACLDELLREGLRGLLEEVDFYFPWCFFFADDFSMNSSSSVKRTLFGGDFGSVPLSPESCLGEGKSFLHCKSIRPTSLFMANSPPAPLTWLPPRARIFSGR